VVNCNTSQCVRCTLEKALTSLSTSRIIQLYSSFQDLRHCDTSITIYVQQVKSLFDELVVASQPISLEDFNLYVFHCLRGEFKDLVTNLVTKVKLLLYTDLHNHLLTHKFLYKNSLHSMNANLFLMSSPLLLQPPLLSTPQPSNHLATSHHNPNFSHNRGHSRGN